MSIGTQCWKMVSNVYTVLETLAFTKSNQNGTNILVLKDIVHTAIKKIRGKATVITLDSHDQGHMKEVSLEKEKYEEEKEKEKKENEEGEKEMAFTV